MIVKNRGKRWDDNMEEYLGYRVQKGRCYKEYKEFEGKVKG